MQNGEQVTIYEAVAADPEDFKLDAVDWTKAFEIAIRADMVATVVQFSPRVYTKFNPDWENKIGKPHKPTKQELIVELKKFDRFRQTRE